MPRKYYLRGKLTGRLPRFGATTLTALGEELEHWPRTLRSRVLPADPPPAEPGEPARPTPRELLERHITQEIRRELTDKGDTVDPGDLTFEFTGNGEFMAKLDEYLHWYGFRTVQVAVGESLWELTIGTTYSVTGPAVDASVEVMHDRFVAADEDPIGDYSSHENLVPHQLRRLEDICTPELMTKHVSSGRVMADARAVKNDRKGTVPASSTVDLSAESHYRAFIKEMRELNLDGTYERLAARGRGNGVGEPITTRDSYPIVRFDGATGSRLADTSTRFRYAVRWDLAKRIYLVHHFAGHVDG